MNDWPQQPHCAGHSLVTSRRPWPTPAKTQAGGSPYVQVRTLNMKRPHRQHWRRRRGYHHGNLREVLIEAARQLIEQRGPEGFSLTEAARLAGVSPAAPYRHFKDREALLSEVARSGFERFADRLDEAWNDGMPTPIVAFGNIGKAYLAFARDEAASYSAMFEAGLAIAEEPALNAAADRAFAVLRAASQRVAEAVPVANRPPGDLMCLHVWAMSHGVVSLLSEGKPGRGKVPMSADDVLEAGILIYLKGLGIIPDNS